MRYRVIDKYYNWLIDIVTDSFYSDAERYSEVFNQLFSTPYHWTVERDYNRSTDGLQLRKTFADLNYCDENFWYKLPAQCTVLEMMVALAIRSDEDLMHIEDENLPAEIFWVMFNNLGLAQFDDDNYDEEVVDYILERFMNNEYSKNGDGALFVVSNKNLDMRKTEIWYQLVFYLGERYPENEQL